jgi:hypothetical protein
MPVFSLMSGSAVAGNCVRSSLATTRAGTYAPVETMVVVMLCIESATDGERGSELLEGRRYRSVYSTVNDVDWPDDTRIP